MTALERLGIDQFFQEQRISTKCTGNSGLFPLAKPSQAKVARFRQAFREICGPFTRLGNGADLGTVLHNKTPPLV